MTVAPGILNLTFPQGATWDLSLTWTDASASPISLANYSARMQVRLSHQSASIVLSLMSGNGLTLGGVAGTIDMSVAASVTTTIPANTYVYDLEVQSDSGVVSRVVEGSFTVTPEVTR